MVAREDDPRWVVLFPDEVAHEPVCGWLRDLAACDVSPATLRSYGYDLLRWLRFLYVIGVAWRRAERVHVRGLVEFLRAGANPLRVGRSPAAPPPGSLNAVTGKPYPGAGYAPRTINHQLTALHSFYSYALDMGLGPLVNPVLVQRGPVGGGPQAHQGPLEPLRRTRRATYRQKVPRALPRGIPDDAAGRLFGALRCHRDLALVAFYLSSGARASELLGLRHEWIDYGRRTIKVIFKGSRALEEIPASADAFVWLALYLAQEQATASAPAGPGPVAGPVWWTRRKPRRPLNYHALRAVLIRANAELGTNYSLHDLRHTAAERMAADDNFSLIKVQTILRHASLASTQLYLRPRLDDLVDKVAELHQRRTAAAALPPGAAAAAESVDSGLVVPAGYDPGDLAELLGLAR